MTYTVTWRVAAITALGALESAVADPNRVRKDAAHIDYTLRRTPRDQGESREPGIRVWYSDVLGVRYRVDDATYTVDVLAVGPARRR